MHLVLLHEQDNSGRRDQLVLIRDNAQSIEYLVGNKEEYMEREGKVPKASFGGRMIPRYLLHYDFVLIRDFLDLFKYDRDIVHVTEYADNTRRGSDAVKHWRVGGA